MAMIDLFDTIPSLGDGGVRLAPLDATHAEGLQELMGSGRVYRYLPTFLFEQRYSHATDAIEAIYGEPLAARESLILGVSASLDGASPEFVGLAEFYGLRDEIHKVSIGYRLLERAWGRGVATATVGLMVDYLYAETTIEIITASTMVENKASARVLQKNGFLMVNSAVDEDWGYPEPTVADKWFR